MLPNYKFASLDISNNMYLNFPIPETKNILENIMEHHLLDTHKKTRNFNMVWHNYKTDLLH
jgi:hypothetical protein